MNFVSFELTGKSSNQLFYFDSFQEIGTSLKFVGFFVSYPSYKHFFLEESKDWK